MGLKMVAPLLLAAALRVLAPVDAPELAQASAVLKGLDNTGSNCYAI